MRRNGNETGPTPVRRVSTLEFISFHAVISRGIETRQTTLRRRLGLARYASALELHVFPCFDELGQRVASVLQKTRKSCQRHIVDTAQLGTNLL